MTRIIILIAVLVLAPAAFAQEPGSTGLENSELHKTPKVQPGASSAPTTFATDSAAVKNLLATVSDVNAIQIAALLEKIAAVTAGKDGSMATLFAIQAELTRQTGAFKKAQSAGLSGANQDVDALFAEVIDGKTGATPDAEHLARVAGTYEALLTQFGQLVNSRFLASNAGGIPTYRGEQHATAATSIGEAARIRSAAYETNVNRASLELRTLLALDAGR